MTSGKNFYDHVSYVMFILILFMVAILIGVNGVRVEEDWVQIVAAIPATAGIILLLNYKKYVHKL